ncbi:MAG: hypothetical protein EXS36_08800 [Pedosphaera sp.]|nr:hypothetical protein [Pedosphaera sp.]
MRAQSLLLLFWLAAVLIRTSSQAADRGTVSPLYRDLRFTLSAPYSTKAEVTRRFGYREPLTDVDVAKEQFQMLVPASYSTNSD